jgi:hypothetical protein
VFWIIGVGAVAAVWAVDFGGQAPDYTDCAYLALTIGMRH